MGSDVPEGLGLFLAFPFLHSQQSISTADLMLTVYMTA